jgi:hypothetical protein
LKLYALAGVTIFSALGYLWLRWKLATKRAATAEEKAQKLEQTRALEQRIAAARAKTREKQDKLRAEIRSRKDRDYFEH